eukprot:scaffold85022_cov16-Prasinocladus_malaysianus.AAC.1
MRKAPTAAVSVRVRVLYVLPFIFGLALNHYFTDTTSSLVFSNPKGIIIGDEEVKEVNKANNPEVYLCRPNWNRASGMLRDTLGKDRRLLIDFGDGVADLVNQYEPRIQEKQSPENIKKIGGNESLRIGL